MILQELLKGLILWLYGLILEGVENMSGNLLEVFSMDLDFFEAYAPVTSDIISVITATGWALLIGNLAFQAMRSMASGIGFDGEDPKLLFARTFVFSFLLVASRQICDIGLSMAGTVIELMGIPDSVVINTPEEFHFGIFDSSWLFVVIVGLIIIFQFIMLFLDIAERYVVMAVLTIMAPLAFAMGGSKNTEDIFKGWARMYGSMCVMMVMNVAFLKLLLSAMSSIPTGPVLLIWLIFIVGIVRVARKIDDMVGRIGLNPTRTGAPSGSRIPLMLSLAVAHNLGKIVASKFADRPIMAWSSAAAGAYSPIRTPLPPTSPNAGAIGSESSHSSHEKESSTQETHRESSRRRKENRRKPSPNAPHRPPVARDKKRGQSGNYERRTPREDAGDASPQERNNRPNHPDSGPPPSRPPVNRPSGGAAAVNKENDVRSSSTKQHISKQTHSRNNAASSQTAQHSSQNRGKDSKAKGTASNQTAPKQNKDGRSAQEQPRPPRPRSNGGAGSNPDSVPPAARRDTTQHRQESKGAGTTSPGSSTPPSPRRNAAAQEAAKAPPTGTTSPGGSTPPGPRSNAAAQEAAKIPPAGTTSPGGSTPPGPRRNAAAKEAAKAPPTDTASSGSSTSPSPRRNAAASEAAKAPPTGTTSAARNNPPGPRSNNKGKGQGDGGTHPPRRPPLNKDRGREK